MPPLTARLPVGTEGDRRDLGLVADRSWVGRVTRRVISRFAEVSPDPNRAHRLDDLTTRERDLLLHVAGGGSNADIARTLGIEEATVKSHVSNILLKLRLHNRVQAVIAAYETGLVTPAHNDTSKHTGSGGGSTG
jgi:DNA-binding NarL/FixJ family response regulator